MDFGALLDFQVVLGCFRGFSRCCLGKWWFLPRKIDENHGFPAFLEVFF